MAECTLSESLEYDFACDHGESVVRSGFRCECGTWSVTDDAGVGPLLPWYTAPIRFDLTKPDCLTADGAYVDLASIMSTCLSAVPVCDSGVMMAVEGTEIV